MESAILEQFQKLPLSGKQEALRYLEALVSQYEDDQINRPVLNRSNAFGIWKGKVWMSDDFDAPLDELQEYMQ
jgi:Protein of unknown function (DUF2281)